MKATAALLAALILASIFLPAPAPAHPRNPYSLWGLGNCVRFAWDKALLAWGVELPWAGDARNWVRLAGTTLTVAGAVYHLELLDRPEPGCLMVLQPEVLKGSPYASLGHVAWVAEAKELRVGWKDAWADIPPELNGWWELRLEESAVYPEKDWCQGWMDGTCWWRSVYFWRPGTPGVAFLGLRRAV